MLLEGPLQPPALPPQTQPPARLAAHSLAQKSEAACFQLPVPEQQAPPHHSPEPKPNFPRQSCRNCTKRKGRPLTDGLLSTFLQSHATTALLSGCRQRHGSSCLAKNSRSARVGSLLSRPRMSRRSSTAHGLSFSAGTSGLTCHATRFPFPRRCSITPESHHNIPVCSTLSRFLRCLYHSAAIATDRLAISGTTKSHKIRSIAKFPVIMTTLPC